MLVYNWLPWPYAALAIVNYEYVDPTLYVHAIFRHPMDQDAEPPEALWTVEVDGVEKGIIHTTWHDAYTFEIVCPGILAPPDRVQLAYDGPDPNLRTTWHKQWEPWAFITAYNVAA